MFYVVLVVKILVLGFLAFLAELNEGSAAAQEHGAASN